MRCWGPLQLLPSCCSLGTFNSVAPSRADAPFSEAHRSLVLGGQRMQTESPGLPDVGVPC